MGMFELLTQTAIADRDLLLKHDGEGDDFKLPRQVDFAFNTGERMRADDFAEFVNGKGYGDAQIEQVAAGHFRILVLITMPINQNIINSVSGFMLCLSRLFGIDYDGWGSVIQKH